MAKPRVFVSSTYYDLRHIRSSLQAFIEGLGFDPVLFERGDIAWDPDVPLDKSCCRDVGAADIFVLIIGSRYGSPTSDTDGDGKEYESITRAEYLTAVKEDVPVYILVEKAVYSSYEVFRENRDGDCIKYPHGSRNVFLFIDDILKQRRNNPFFAFDGYREAEEWLRQQWAGLFRDLLRRRKEVRPLVSLQGQIEVLSGVAETLKRYNEELLKKLAPGPESEKLISDEEKRLSQASTMREFSMDPDVFSLIHLLGIQANPLAGLLMESESAEDFWKGVREESVYSPNICDIMYERADRTVMERLIARVREKLDLPPLKRQDGDSTQTITAPVDSPPVG